VNESEGGTQIQGGWLSEAEGGTQIQGGWLSVGEGGTSVLSSGGARGISPPRRLVRPPEKMK